jgi:uncharacterized protein (TIGR03382 family)
VRAALLAAALVLAAAAPRTALAYAPRQTCPNGPTTCVTWNSQSVTWKLNTTRASAAPDCGADAVAAAVQAAFSAWQLADAGAGKLELPYGGATSSVDTSNGSTGSHIVVFRQGWCSENTQAANDPCFPDGTCASKYNCFDDPGGMGDHGTLAITGVKYVGNCIVDADMEVADWNGQGTGTAIENTPDGDAPHGWVWSCTEPASGSVPPSCSTYGETGCVYEDLQNTVTHEAGHFIGLAHPCEFGGRGGAPACTSGDDGSTMYPSAGLRETSKRTLADTDVDDVQTAYPPGFAGSLTCPSTSTKSGCGCGGAPVGGILALLGLSALAPRLRRRR